MSFCRKFLFCLSFLYSLFCFLSYAYTNSLFVSFTHTHTLTHSLKLSLSLSTSHIYHLLSKCWSSKCYGWLRRNPRYHCLLPPRICRGRSCERGGRVLRHHSGTHPCHCGCCEGHASPSPPSCNTSCGSSSSLGCAWCTQIFSFSFYFLSHSLALYVPHCFCPLVLCHLSRSQCIRTPTGLEPSRIGRTSGFINIGERCNVSGSRVFCKMIRDGDFDKALAVAKKQVNISYICIYVCYVCICTYIYICIGSSFSSSWTGFTTVPIHVTHILIHHTNKHVHS